MFFFFCLFLYFVHFMYVSIYNNTYIKFILESSIHLVCSYIFLSVLLTFFASLVRFKYERTLLQKISKTMALSAYYYISFWILSSCTMILFNKSVLSHLGFDLPIFLTFFHMLFATIATQVFHSRQHTNNEKRALYIYYIHISMFYFSINHHIVSLQIMARTTNMLPAVSEKRLSWGEALKAVVPVALSFSLSLIFSNSAYLTLSGTT